MPEVSDDNLRDKFKMRNVIHSALEARRANLPPSPPSVVLRHQTSGRVKTQAESTHVNQEASRQLSNAAITPWHPDFRRHPTETSEEESPSPAPFRNSVQVALSKIIIPQSAPYYKPATHQNPNEKNIDMSDMVELRKQKNSERSRRSRKRRKVEFQSVKEENILLHTTCLELKARHSELERIRSEYKEKYERTLVLNLYDL
jgi:hypothetical protein